MTEELTPIAIPTAKAQIPTSVFYFAILIATAALFLVSRSNYLLFHALVELSSVAVAITLFSIGWNTRNIAQNEPLTLLAISFLVIGGIDLLHTLSYKGMGIFPGAGVDPPTQLWIAARFLESISYLLAALLLNRSFRFNTTTGIISYFAAGTLLVLSIWPLNIFPSCLVEGEGLTLFKVVAEYVLALVLAVSGILFWKNRERMPRPLLNLLLNSIVLSIAAKMAFTLYSDVYGFTNVLGHILRFAAVVLVYRAMTLGALKDPFQSLFRDLKISNQALDVELAQRRRTEEELRRANQELDAFVHTISHDLRSPLTVITGSSELLKMELSDQLEGSYLELLDNIYFQGHHMADMLKNLLSLASIGRVEKSPERVSLASVATHVVADLKSEISAAGCQVKILHLPEMYAHASLIYQLFSNLIGNAVRYGKNSQQPITVGGERVGRKLYLYVADHGPGIPAQDREAIFEVFSRGTKAPELSGTGVGLASAKKIAFFYDGNIFAEETPGGGATFRVELTEPEDPVAENSPEPS